MPRLRSLCLLALLGLAVTAVPADARGRQQPAPPPAPALPPALEQLPQPAVLPAPPTLAPAAPALPVVPPAAVRALSVREFAAAFHPAPGTYEVLLVHPKSGRPVLVCFTLPPGCPDVKVSKHQLEFDYGRQEVEIRFTLFGKVKVDYD